jgi:NAD(P)-dependent dehydrogenase (short-subunit alcohol dehydrogenase family)
VALTIDLQGRVAVVTGVSNGIGAGVARMLAKAGAQVAGCARSNPDHPQIRALSEDISNAGVRFRYAQVDVTSDASLERFIEETAEHFGHIDILVSNAGVNVFEGATGCDADRWQYNIDLNLKSHWMISKLCRPYLMKSRNGTIIIMTSNHAIATIPGCFPYNVTKTALTGLVRSLAIEWGPSIRTVGLAPGFIDTPGNDKWFASFPDPEQERERTVNMHPAGKLGTPEEVGAFCAYLSSPYASFMTGSTYVMDGGRTALLQDE